MNNYKVVIYLDDNNTETVKVVAEDVDGAVSMTEKIYPYSVNLAKSIVRTS